LDPYIHISGMVGNEYHATGAFAEDEEMAMNAIEITRQDLAGVGVREVGRRRQSWDRVRLI